jgi:Glycosyltransferase family 87
VARLRRGVAANPHAVLLAGSAVVLALEGFRGSATLQTSAIWPILEGLAGVAMLAIAWRAQDRLRLGHLLLIAAGLQLGWTVLHLALGVQSDFDSRLIYPQQGNQLLHGSYPNSEYPPGAVLLFAFDALVSGGTEHGVRVAHAFAMVPFQLATVVGVWSLRTQYSRWFAALVGLWPLDAFFVEFKYDPAPTAALVVGLALVLRGRWRAVGVALGLGAALKWTPALAAAALALWLIASKRPRDALRLALWFCSVFAAINVVFVAIWPGRVVHAYTSQGSRAITGESLAYLPLRLFGQAHLPPNQPFWGGAVVSHLAELSAVAVQTVCVLAILAATRVVRGRVEGAVAVAAMAPVGFLLTNRVFSPQYLVLILAAWSVAGALVVRGRREQALLAVPMVGATLANVLVYPTVVPTYWVVCSGVLFILAFVATLWILVRACAPPDARGVAPL